jgi:type IV pilus assembly protein PilX
MSSQHLITCSLPDRQRGITLIIALIFLGVLTLLGITAAQVMSLEERMAGNARNKDLAFQAAEAALQAAEAEVPSYAGAAFAGSIRTPGSGGMYVYDLCMPNGRNFWNGSSAMKDCTGTSAGPFNWAASSAAKTPSVALSGIKSQPQYVVEKMPDLGAAKRYRVTARGVGGDDNAVVILQAIYTN